MPVMLDSSTVSPPQLSLRNLKNLFPTDWCSAVRSLKSFSCFLASLRTATYAFHSSLPFLISGEFSSLLIWLMRSRSSFGFAVLRLLIVSENPFASFCCFSSFFSRESASLLAAFHTSSLPSAKAFLPLAFNYSICFSSFWMLLTACSELIRILALYVCSLVAIKNGIFAYSLQVYHFVIRCENTWISV